MHSCWHALAIAAGFALSFTSAAAQTTWTVSSAGGANFTTIQAAVNAASPGDTIQVMTVTASNGYAGFVARKPLRIIGWANIDGTVDIQNIAAGEVFELNTLVLRAGAAPGVRVSNCTGLVVLDHLFSGSGFLALSRPGVEATQSGQLVIKNCSLAVGATFTDSTAVFVDGYVTPFSYGTVPELPPITATRSQIFLAGTSVQGGIGSITSSVVHPPVVMSNSSLFVGRGSSLTFTSNPFGPPSTLAVSAVVGTGTVKASPHAVLNANGGAPLFAAGISASIGTCDELTVEDTTATVHAGAGDLVIMAVGVPGPSHALPWLPGMSWFTPTGPIFTAFVGMPTASTMSIHVAVPSGLYAGRSLSWLALTVSATSGYSATNPIGMGLW